MSGYAGLPGTEGGEANTKSDDRLFQADTPASVYLWASGGAPRGDTPAAVGREETL